MVDVNEEVSQLVSLANNLRNAGRRGQLQSKNPFYSDDCNLFVYSGFETIWLVHDTKQVRHM